MDSGGKGSKMKTRGRRDGKPDAEFCSPGRLLWLFWGNLSLFVPHKSNIFPILFFIPNVAV